MMVVFWYNCSFVINLPKNEGPAAKNEIKNRNMQIKMNGIAMNL